MSPAKKLPRPVTMWCGWSRVGSLTWLTAADGLAMERGDISPDEAADESGSIRCRVTPIRPATDAEIERLAKAMWRSMPKGPWWCPWERTSLSTRGTVRCLAIAAWRRGAR